MANLPEEVLQHTFSYLQVDLNGDEKENQQKAATLAAVCRASRTFNKIAGPVLYRTVIIKAGYKSFHNGTSNITQLLTSLLTRSHLAMEVREICVTGWICRETSQDYEFRASEACAQSQSSHQRISLPDSILAASMQLVNQQAASHYDEDHLLPMLLSLCLNVEHLEFPVVEDIGMTRFMAFARECIDRILAEQRQDTTRQRRTALPLGKIQSIAFRAEDAVDLHFYTTRAPSQSIIEEIEEVSYFQCLPLLSSVRGQRLWQASDYAYTTYANIRKISVDNFGVSLARFAFTLQMYPNLVELHVVDTELAAPSDQTSSFGRTYSNLGQVLRYLGTSLQRLTIKPRPGNDPCEQVGDLRALVQLKSLSCLPSAFAISQKQPWLHHLLPFAVMLPQSLQKLEIARCDDPDVTFGIVGLNEFLETQVQQTLDGEDFSCLTEVNIQSQSASIVCSEKWHMKDKGDWLLCRKTG